MQVFNLVILKLQFSIFADTFSNQMSPILINFDINKLYLCNLQIKTSCCKKPNFLKTEPNKHLKINNETMFLTKAIQSQIYKYFELNVFYRLHFRCLLDVTKPSQHAHAGPLMVNVGNAGSCGQAKTVRARYRSGAVFKWAIVNSRRVQEPCGSDTVW